MNDFTPAELSAITDALLDRLAMLHTTLQNDPRVQWYAQPKIDIADALLAKLDTLMGV